MLASLRVFVLMIAAAGAAAAPAQASFPGGNGLVAFSCTGNPSGGFCVVRPGERGVWHLPGAGGEPQWAPDGRRVVTRSPRRETGALITITDVVTRAVREVVVDGPTERIAWAPDGRHLVATSYPSALLVIDSETGERRSIPTGQDDLRAAASAPAVSPDGRVIASAWFGEACSVPAGHARVSAARPCGAGDVLLTPFDGGPSRVLTDGTRDLRDPEWSLDGSRLLATCSYRRVCAIDAQSGVVADPLVADLTDPAVAPDGSGALLGVVLGPRNYVTLVDGDKRRSLGAGFGPSWQPLTPGVAAVPGGSRLWLPTALGPVRIRGHARDEVSVRVTCRAPSGDRCAGSISVRLRSCREVESDAAGGAAIEIASRGRRRTVRFGIFRGGTRIRIRPGTRACLTASGDPVGTQRIVRLRAG